MLTDERRSARHPGAASMQLHGTARHCRLLCQSLRTLKSCATLAPSPPHSRRVMPGHVSSAWTVLWRQPIDASQQFRRGGAWAPRRGPNNAQ
eukprot:scaffold12060_cov60-Phaeocystis_antarctica.AAC.3